MVRTFQDLDVFQRAYAVSLEMHKRSLEFPKLEQYALADQIRRASKSICANIAEGFGKQSHSPAEFRRFLSMAIGSSDEMRVWVMYAKDLGYITPEEKARWDSAYTSIARMLHSLRNSKKLVAVSDNRLPITDHR